MVRKYECISYFLLFRKHNCTHPCIEHLVPKAAVEFLRVGFCREEVQQLESVSYCSQTAKGTMLLVLRDSTAHLWIRGTPV